MTLAQSPWVPGLSFLLLLLHSYLSLSTVKVVGQWAQALLICTPIQVDLKGVSHGGDRKQVVEAMTFLLRNWKQT